MTALIVLGCIAAYFLVGLLYARSQYLQLWQECRDKLTGDLPLTGHMYLDGRVKSRAAWRVPAWPYALVYDAVRGPVGQWFTKPVTDRQAYAEQLRADAKAWETKRWSGTPAEREMATELARICKERADEVEP